MSAWLLTLDGAFGLQGWQWLFLIEALPPIIMCVITWVLLTDRPKDAAWLRPEQRTWLQQRLDSEQSQRESVHRFEIGETMRENGVWRMLLNQLLHDFNHVENGQCIETIVRQVI